MDKSWTPLARVGFDLGVSLGLGLVDDPATGRLRQFISRVDQL